AHCHNRPVRGGVRRPALARGDDAPELAPESRIRFAIPHIAQRCLEDVAERAPLQDAARCDRTAGAHDERVPSDDARLIESRALAIDAAKTPRRELMPDLLPPGEIAPRDEMRQAADRAARAPLRIEAAGDLRNSRTQVLLEAVDLGDAPELVGAHHLL